MSDKIHPVLGQAPPEHMEISADRVAAGKPHTIARTDYERGDKIFAGEWSATVGAWSVKYDEWEFCHMLEGVCELETSDGETRRFQAGDSFIIEPGFIGVWRVIEPMRKRFVIRYD